MTSITIPDSVTTIGSNAFRVCSSLTSITIPDSVTNIGERAFQSCTSLNKVNFTQNSTDIEYDSSANKLNFANNIFANTNTNNSPFTINITQALLDRFNDNGNFSDNNYQFAADPVDFLDAKNVTFINTYIFTGTGTLTAQIVSNSEIKGNSDITTVIIEGYTTIDNSAFNGYTNLTSIIIPDSVTTIGDYAFYGCTSLPSITIPDSVTTIGKYAFRKCTKLTSVTIKKINNILQGADIFTESTNIERVIIEDATLDDSDTQITMLNGMDVYKLSILINKKAINIINGKP